MYLQCSNISGLTPEQVLLLILGFLVLMIWSLVWKGIALWKSAQNKRIDWFVVLLILNTVGILEILYIFVFSKKGQNKSNQL